MSYESSVKSKLVNILKGGAAGPTSSSSSSLPRPELRVQVSVPLESGFGRQEDVDESQAKSPDEMTPSNDGMALNISLPRTRTSQRPSPLHDLNRNDSSSDNVWQGICVGVLPLFNGETTKSSMEEMNAQVEGYIKRTLDRSPGHAPEIILNDLRALVATGMLTLASEGGGASGASGASGGPGEVALERILPIWSFFHQTVLIPFCAVFVPVERDGRLRDLLAMAQRGAGGGAGGELRKKVDPVHDSFNERSLPFTGPYLPQEGLDVRKIALTVFRNVILYPKAEALEALFDRVFQRCARERRAPFPPSQASSPTVVSERGTEMDLAGPLLRMLASIHYAQNGESASPQKDLIERLLKIVRHWRYAPQEELARPPSSASSGSASHVEMRSVAPEGLENESASTSPTRRESVETL